MGQCRQSSAAAQGGSTQIHYELQTGKTVEEVVKPNATVANEEDMLAAKQGLPTAKVGTRGLEDQDTLSDCVVKRESLMNHNAPVFIQFDVYSHFQMRVWKLRLRMHQNDLISDVKLKIQAELGVDISRQILDFFGEVLENHNSLYHDGIQENSFVCVKFLPMKISIMHPREGSPVSLICWPIHSIDDIKERIKNAFGLQSIEMHISYNGLDLSDGAPEKSTTGAVWLKTRAAGSVGKRPTPSSRASTTALVTTEARQTHAPSTMPWLARRCCRSACSTGRWAVAVTQTLESLTRAPFCRRSWLPCRQQTRPTLA